MAEEIIIGLDRLMRDLDDLPVSLNRKKLIIARSLRKSGDIIRKRIAGLAPDDPTTPGSQIAKNIDINVTGQTSEGALAYIGPTSAGFIAGFHERGTAHQPARPFISVAFEETFEEAIEMFADETGTYVEKELTKLG